MPFTVAAWAVNTAPVTLLVRVTATVAPDSVVPAKDSVWSLVRKSVLLLPLSVVMLDTPTVGAVRSMITVWVAAALLTPLLVATTLRV